MHAKIVRDSRGGAKNTQKKKSTTVTRYIKYSGLRSLTKQKTISE